MNFTSALNLNTHWINFHAMLRFYAILFFFFAVVELSASGLVKTVSSLKVVAYPGHTELSWKNKEGFNYSIYTVKEGNYTFVSSTTEETYTVFHNLRETSELVRFAVIPSGMKPEDLPNATFYFNNRVVTPADSLHKLSLNGFFVECKMIKDSDEALLDMVQKYTTAYFDEFSQEVTGMARERSNDTNGDIVTTGGTGFGIMALIAGVERGYLTRSRAFQILDKIVVFLEKAERFHGAFAHWYNADNGRVHNFSRFDDGGDLVETAFLFQGLLTARKYFENGNEAEFMLASRISALWESVEWDWYTQGTDSLYWHWSKNFGFKMNHRIKGFDETLITYVLAASSPTHSIGRQVYEASYKNSSYYLNGKSYYGHRLDLGMEYGGPLFFSHYSFLGLDPRGLSDGKVNYFERNKAHSLIHWEYAKDNPKAHKGYGAECWGFTSSDDPLVFYTSHHPGTDQENGTISPTAALSSIVYTPEQSLMALRHFYYIWGHQLFGKYGFYDSFNPGMVKGQQVNRSYLAIDQGPIAVMIENYRSGLLWDLFMKNRDIQVGLDKLGFKYK